VGKLDIGEMFMLFEGKVLLTRSWHNVAVWVLK
jgi:hypothetical protein